MTSEHPSEFGVFLIPEAEDAGRTARRAQLAEELGLDLIGVQDHPYQRRFLDTFSLLAYIAAVTNTIRLVPDVANLPLRPPALLAKLAATIDVLSQGRFELGLGAGAFWDGIAAMGGPRRTPKESVDALEEGIEIIRLIWSGQSPVAFEGEHYTVKGLKPGPAPDHPIGIWLGAYGPRMVRLVGSAADGWLPSVPRLPLEEVPARQQAIDEAARRAGRDPSDIRRVANVHGVITSEGSDGFLRGPASQWVDDLRRLRADYGFDTFIFWGEGDPDDQVRRFAEDVVPEVRAK
ncbi:MAG TPA: LLM class flavin-dependent oxidoreductase [Solirubrobacteraceae bacterium]|jgi:alkanesulfonate monooxygenase SsuD/methylene tetrahydromethanopterin reductase-like flavin-dependent oxidoreductase (luciferase family)